MPKGRSCSKPFSESLRDSRLEREILGSTCITGWEVQRSDGALGVVDTPNTTLHQGSTRQMRAVWRFNISPGELGRPDRAGTDEEMIRNEDDRDGGDG
jgi:hypothetical protein